LQGLTTGISNLSATQLGNLSQNQVALLSTAQIGASGAGSVAGLSAQSLARLSADAVATLLANNGNALSVDQITSLSDAQVATTTLVGAATGLQFNLSWGSSAANAPAGFKQAAIAAAAGLATEFGNKVVLNIQVGYGEVAGQPIDPGAAAESGTYSGGVSYAALTNAFKQYAANSSIQATAAASLPASNPTSGGSFVVSSADAKALGLAPASQNLDGYVGLSSALPFQFNQKAVGGKFDAIGALQHEFSEVMGRTASVGAAQGSHVYTGLDLYRYTSTNNANPSAGTPTRALVQQSGNVAYFSIDNGVTNLGGFNASDGSAGDFGDWNASMGNDPFGFSYPGVIEKMSANDIVVMAALGWNPTSSGITHARAAQTYALV